MEPSRCRSSRAGAQSALKVPSPAKPCPHRLLLPLPAALRFPRLLLGILHRCPRAEQAQAAPVPALAAAEEVPLPRTPFPRLPLQVALLAETMVAAHHRDMAPSQPVAVEELCLRLEPSLLVVLCPLRELKQLAHFLRQPPSHLRPLLNRPLRASRECCCPHHQETTTFSSSDLGTSSSRQLELSITAPL